MIRLGTLAALAILAAPAAALAANARQPYSNVDHRVDAGNDTGDSQVESLNQQQLDHNGRPAAPVPYGYRAPAYPYAPPAAYVPPPVAYVPYYPPYRYYRPYYPYYPY